MSCRPFANSNYIELPFSRKLEISHWAFQEETASIDEFIREYTLENDQGTLYLVHKVEGDVHCVVWDAALLLAKYIEKRCMSEKNFLVGKRVLELGSGLGCVGMVASFYGGHVTMTDLAQALNLLNSNLKRNQKIIESNNKFCAKVQLLDWNEDVKMDPCDIILAADCVYYEESISGLIKTLIRLSTSSTEIYLAQEYRSYSEIQTRIWKKFMDEVSRCFTLHFVPMSEQHEEYRSPDIKLLKLVKL